MANRKRISFLSKLLDGYDTVLDIGTDHGLVLKEALDLGYIKKGIACDINQEPLNQAKRNLNGYPIDFIQSDGFEYIHSSYDAVVIAGMGVHTMMHILDQKHESKIYFLQPNDKYDILRKYLSDFGFKITDEFVIQDKFYYVILKVEKGTMKLAEEDFYLGPVLKKKDESIAYYKHQIKNIDKIIHAADEETSKKYKKILSYYKLYSDHTLT
ncbi:MAG: class I SAM-dependent methyltransferase [Acholeplasmataceae bacterium]